MKRVLVIDNDMDSLTLVQLILSSAGYIVHSHSKWNEGFFQIELVSPAIIIIEVFLDTADGRNLAKQIKNKENTKHIPIILFSKDHSVKDNLKECEANAFIGKPYEINHFINTVNKLIAA